MEKIKIIRSNRKTLAMEIKPDLQIIVRAPLKMKDAEIKGFINRKSEWLKRNLEKVKKRSKEKVAVPKLTLADITSLKKEALPVITEFVAEYSKIIGVRYSKITVRAQKSKWGSCNIKGSLNFNCLLILCPREVLAYVVIHELCHLKQMNHSKLFWLEVEKYCPNYKECRNWLMQNGNKFINAIK